ncbi:MAG: hypothetical protein WBW94_10210 [Anaerolineales bacterium]
MSPERSGGKYLISFEEIASNAKDAVLENGNHVPVLIVEGSKNIFVIPVEAMPDTHGERLEMMRFVGQMAAKSGKVGNLQQAFFISEGWMSMAREDMPPEMRPSDDPNRKEVLIISGLQVKERKKSLKLFEMVRDRSKHVVNLPEILPPQAKDNKVEIPLLDAFAQGFQFAFQARAN